MAVSVVAGLVGAIGQGLVLGFKLKTFLATFAAFTGMSAVAKGLAPKPGTGARMRGITATTREPAATRKMVYGEMRVGGHVVFIGNSDEGATPDNNYLHLVIAFASHEIESYEEIYFNEDRVWDKTNLVDSDWTSVLNVYTHDGSQTLADAQLVTDCFNWTNNHKLLGIAYVHFKMLWDGDKFPNGIPNITAKLKGKKVYDPRDVSQSASTPSTWLWSDNPALVLRDYLTNRYGLDEDDAVISDEAVEVAADRCDESIDLSGGGTQVRYRCNGQLDTNNNIKSNIENILGSMGGFITYTSGKYVMRASSFVTPTVSFDESDITSAITVQTKQSRRSQYNAVKGIYVSSEANYKVCDYPAQISSTYSTEDGALVELDMPLPFVVHNQQAQRLAKIALNKSRQHIVVSASFNLKALQIKVGDTINLSNTRLGFTNKVFEVVDYALQIKAGDRVFVDLTLVESSAAVYDWTTSDEIDFLGDGEVTLDNGRTAQPVSNLTGLEIGLVGPDATLQTAYRLSWDLPDTRFTGDILVSWYDVTGTLPQDLIQGFAGPEATEFLITGLEPGETYSFYVQTINLIGVKSDPTLLSNVLMEGDTTAPALPTQIEANGDYEGIILTWLNPADIDFKHVEVHVSETNTTPAVGAIPAAVIDGEQYIQTGLNGGDTRYFFLRSVDFSDNKSAYTSSVLGIATSIRIKNLGLLLNQNAYPTDLPVAEIKEGEEYEVLTLGTTSAFGWGQLGSLGTVGDVFTATRDGGPEFGTGTVEHTSYVSNDGELALVGLNLNGTLRYGEDASVIWNGKPIDIPFNSSNNFTVLTNLAGKQGWLALDRNKTAPFDMSGTLPNLDVAFVYYFDGDWYYDDDSANPVQFTRTAFSGTTTGTDGTTTARLVALGTLRTGSADEILEGGLFSDPIDLGLVELPENFIDVTKFATQLESDTYVSGTSGWKIERNGNTEFNDITARGAIFATSGSISESVQIGGVDLNDYVARVTGSLALLINKGGGGTTTNNGEGVLVGVEQGAAVNNQNGYITWDGAQVEIPANVTSSGSTFATQLQNQQGFICFDANKQTPFSVFSGAAYADLNCAFVYKIGDQWYFDANDSATVGQTFTPSTLLGSDGSSATDLVALGYIETSTSDVILYGGLFGQPVPLELAAFPSDAIRSGTIGGITITDTKLYEGVGGFKDANTGFYLDSDGDFSLTNKLSFENSTGELIVDGTVRADVIDIVDGALYGDVEASSVAAGQVGIDQVSEAVYNEIKRRFISTNDGFYFSDTGTVDGSTAGGIPVTITSGDLSATALQNENIELECVLTYRFTSTNNYTQTQRNIDILFQWSNNGTSWSNVDVDPDNLHTVTQTQTEFGYVYELNKVIRSTTSFNLSYGYLRLRALPASTGSSSIWAEHPLAVSFVADQAGLIIGSPSTTGEAQFPDGAIINGLTYPDADGTNGQVITTDGAGTLSFTDSGANFLTSNASDTMDGTLTVGGTSVSGIEGGEIRLTKPPTTNLTGDLAFDIQTNSVRFFETAANFRGAYIDITECSDNAASEIYHSGKDLTLTTGTRLNHNTDSTRDKIRVWADTSAYAIGMDNAMLYGHLGDFAMTFQMNDEPENDRGWVFLDTGHSDSQGAMSLTTNGRMTVATSLSIGQGESITSPQSDVLYVEGNPNFAVMPTVESPGKIIISCADGTNREHEIRFDTSPLPSDSYMKFAVHDGTAGSLTEVLSLTGDNQAQVFGKAVIGNHSALATSFNAAASNLIVGDGAGDEGLTIYSGTTSLGSIHFADTATTGGGSYGGYITYNQNNALMTFGTNAQARMYIDSTGQVGIGVTPSYKLHVAGTARFNHSEHQGFRTQVTDSTADQAFHGHYLDVNISGADALTADRTHAGVYVDVDSTATGGDTVNEHRIYGVYSDVRATGDSDLIYGSYSLARSQHSIGTVTNLYGAQNYGFGNNSAGKTTSVYGAYNFGRSSVTGTGEIDNLYGAFNIAQSYQTSTDTGTISHGSSNIVQYTGTHNVNASQARGVWAEVQIDANSNSWALTSAYVVRAEFDNNDTINRTTNGYLFYGDYSGILPTNPWGIYIPADVKNYFAGNVGIGILNGAYELVVSNGGAEGIEFGPAYASGANLIQHYNRSGAAYLRADNIASQHRFLIGANLAVDIEAGRLEISDDGGTGFTHSRVITNSATAARGSGHFMHNTDSDTEWYMGRPYVTGDAWQVSRRGTATHQDNTADTQYALLTVNNSGDLIVESGGDISVVNGYIGVNTTSYAGRIHAKGDQYTRIVADGTSGGAIAFYGGGSEHAQIFSDGSGDLYFRTGSLLTDRISIAATGLTSILSGLDVTGAIDASGDITTSAELGVGTTNPSFDAHILGSGPTLMLESNTTADAELRFGFNTSTTARIRESGDDLIFEAQGIGTANECIKTRPARTDILSSDTYIQSNTRLGATSQMRINSSSSTAIMEGSSQFYVLRQTGGTAMSFQLNGSTETYGMTTNRIFPSADNTRDLGSSTNRWQDVYSAGGVTTSSDERLKQQIRDIDEAECRVAVAAKGLLKAYKYNDAVEKKGDDARWHFGIIAQELKAAFEAEGLDAHDYGMLVYNEVWEADEWIIDVDSEEGGWYTTKTWDTAEEAPDYAVRKDEYAIRYQELLAFIIAAL